MGNIFTLAKLLPCFDFNLDGPLCRVVDKHLQALVLKKKQCITEYGTFDTKRWQNEKIRFYETVVVPTTSRLYRNQGEFCAFIDLAIDKLKHDFPVRRSKVGDGPALEAEVSLRMEKLGWSTEIIGSSGDQGVDIIARKRGRCVAIQCKSYQKPVGNRGVQEVISGALFRGASEKVVISVNGFTKAARSLASVAGVKLLNISEIRKI